MKLKKIPQRTCLGCKAVRPKKELVRIVRTPQGEVVVDPTGKKSGRGAYTCPNPACLESALAGSSLDKALEVRVTPEIRDRLKEELSSLTR